MTEDREQAGAPVEQTEVSNTEVLAAVERASEAASATGDVAPPATSAESLTQVPSDQPDRPIIAAVVEPPNAGKLETAEEIFAAHTPSGGASAVTPSHDVTDSFPVDSTDLSRGGENLNAPLPARDGEVFSDDLPPVLPAPAVANTPVAANTITVNADHPMAALYAQTPMPPDVRGNRAAGVLIAVLATVGFAAVFAGLLALWLAPSYPPSTFLNQGLLPWLTQWGSAAAAVGFFVSLALLVLIVGRAGWWAYVLGGLFVGLATWASAVLGFAVNDRIAGEVVSLQPLALLEEYGLSFPAIAAGLAAREVSVWFGAWIGARGRRMKRLNAEASKEYENTLAEVQANQP